MATNLKTGKNIGKEEEKWSIFADDMIVNLESPKASGKNPLELSREFCKVDGSKNMPKKKKSLAFLYSSNKIGMEKNHLKSTPMEYLDITKKGNNKIILKYVKGETERHAIFLDEKTQCHKNVPSNCVWISWKLTIRWVFWLFVFGNCIKWS